MKTIRQQLTRALLLTVGLLIGAGGLGVYLCTRAALVAQFDAALRARAQALSTLTEQKGRRLEIDFSDEQMRGFEAGGGDFFELWQSDGTLVERSRSLRDAQLPLRHGTFEAPLVWNLTLPDGRAGRALGVQFRPQGSDGQKQGTPSSAILVVASERRALDRTLAILQFVLAGGGLLLLAATALVVPRVLRRGLAPLQRLSNEAAHIEADSLSARFPTDGLPGELVPITAHLNDLLDRLETSFERERRFTSNVAHELRTPVAELRAMAELAVKLPEARAAGTDQEVLAIALHLESLLTRLLALARSERRQLALQTAPVAVAALAESIWQPLQDQAARKRLAVRLDVPADARLTTDGELLRSILQNLLANAVEYTPEGGQVDLHFTSGAGRFALTLANTATNLEPSDVPHLFGRFWRKDSSRTDGTHAGLGLSLARSFAELLGFRLTATLTSPRRLTLNLSGPLPDGEPSARLSDNPAVATDSPEPAPTAGSQA